jgi:hypothetical protein
VDTEDELLLLAHGIVTFDVITSGVVDLDTLGVTTPHRMEWMVRKHLTSFAQLWWADTHGDPVWRDEYLERAIEEARQWVSARTVRLTELREGKVRSDR